jgi:DNA-binding beta-propeller fold protein YncE
VPSNPSICSGMKNISNGCSALFLSFLCCVACGSCRNSHSSETSLPTEELVFVADIPLPFPEPSGIAYSESLQKLWVVSGGSNQHIYVLDTNGIVERRLFFSGTDLEGIAFDEIDSTLWVIDEDTKRISHLDLDGNLLAQKYLSYDAIPNKGPEGITIGQGHTFYILNQRDPSVLYELDSVFQIAHSYPLGFAPDYSDIAYDSSSDSFFILSGASAEFFAWTKQQGAKIKYSLPDIGNEGIAYDRKRNFFYIVNDASGYLSIYRKK